MQVKPVRYSSVKGALFAILMICFEVSIAQQPYIPFQHFSGVDGLSQNQVRSIFQDRQGFMWFGTLEGLNRFDGYEFVRYQHDATNPSSLSSDFVCSMAEDKIGNLWIGTGGGLSRFDRATDSFKSYVHNPNDSSSISPGAINTILVDKKENFWLAFVTGYVDYFDRKTEKFTHYKVTQNLVDVTALAEDQGGNLWIGSQEGIVVLDSAHERINRFVNNKDDNGSLSNNKVNHIFAAADKTIWIGTDDGINMYDFNKRVFVRYFHNVNSSNSISTNIVKCTGQDKEGRLWIGTENGGLDIWDRHTNNFYHYKKNESDIRAISDNSIYSIFKDRLDNMWVGTNSGGVNFYDRFRKPFVIFQNVPGDPTSLSNNNVTAVAEEPGHGFWVATDGGGLDFFDEKTGIFKTYRQEADDSQSIPSNFVVDVLWDEANACLWVATWGGGLARMNTRTGKFKRYRHHEGDDSSIASDNLWRLHQDEDGVLYIGTVGKGLSILDKTNSKFSNYGPEDGLNEENVVSLCRDEKNFLWIGAWSNGLSRMDLSTRKFVPLPKGIINTSNESISADSHGRIWIAGSPGIQGYDLKKDSVFVLSVKEGLPSTNINGFIIDAKDHFWLATNKGIAKYDPQHNKSSLYSVVDGLPANQFSARLFRTPAGKMYFGSVNGLVVFHPDSITQNPIVPNVFITELKIFNKPVVAGEEDKILTRHISETREISLNFEQNFITLSFVALNFSSPHGNKYKYRLRGIDKDWIMVDNQRSASYTSLDPGDYEFTVKASNNDGLWNDEGRSLVIHILPPWWRTFWFRLLVVLFAGLIVISVYTLRVKSIASQNKKLSALVREKTREITTKNEMLQERQEEIETHNKELKQSQEELLTNQNIVLTQNKELAAAHEIIEKQNQEIKRRNENLEQEVLARTKELLAHTQQLEQFAFISAHNLRAPVARILGLGNLLDLDAHDPEANKLVYQKMVLTARDLDRVVRDLNTILEIRKSNPSSVTTILFEEELKLVKQTIEKEIEDTNTMIKADFSKAPVITSVKPYVESVLHNLITNAIKYRSPDRLPLISIATYPINGYLCLSVSDNGLGIDTEQYKDKIFTLYQRFHSHVEGKGLGLYLIKTQVEALGGKIELESQVNEGTTFRVYFQEGK